MSWIETISGNKVDLLDPDPNSFTLEDIFHALLNVPRFGGHTRTFYSVAMHSVNVARLVPDHLKFEAIMHDATEAYLMDMPTPYKALLPDYRAAEENLWLAICKKFDLPEVLDPLVKQADRCALISERNYLKGKCDWGDLERTLIVPPAAFIWANMGKLELLKLVREYEQNR